MKVVWLPLAAADYDEITDYLLLTASASAAEKRADLVLAAVQMLVDYPRSGRPGMIPGTYEKVCSGTPYIAAYQITGDLVTILRVYHGKRKLPLSQPMPRRAH